MARGRPPPDIGIQIRALVWLEVFLSSGVANQRDLNWEESRPHPVLSWDYSFKQVYLTGCDPHRRRKGSETESLVEYGDPDEQDFATKVYFSPLWKLLIPPEPNHFEVETLILGECAALKVNRELFYPIYDQFNPDAPLLFDLSPSKKYLKAIRRVSKTESISGLSLLCALFKEAVGDGAFRHALAIGQAIADAATRFLQFNVRDEFTRRMFVALISQRLFKGRWDDFISPERLEFAELLIGEMYRAKKRKARYKSQVIPSLAVRSVALLLFEETYADTRENEGLSLLRAKNPRRFEDTFHLIRHRFNLR